MTETWEQEARRLFDYWILKLLPVGWQVNLVADGSLAGAYAEVESTPGSRRSTIRFNPEHRFPSRTACHEVSHILLSHLSRAAESIADQLPEPAKALAHDLLVHESEETANLLVDAFLRAKWD